MATAGSGGKGAAQGAFSGEEVGYEAPGGEWGVGVYRG